jgi:hypothetical protein
MNAGSRRSALGLVVTLIASSVVGSAQIPDPLPPSIGGCPSEVVAFHTCALQKARTFAPPRTPGGKPNLQGYWRSLLTQPFSIEGVTGTEPLVGDLVMPWAIAPGMIVDPPDGKIPYQPWAEAVGRRGINFEKYIDPRTACGPGGVPRLALQDANQIIQPTGDGHVVWLFEDHHVNRIIAMDGGPAPGPDIKLRVGYSRGRWDGNTLVVDTTNLNAFTWFDDSGNFYTDAAHLVERLTLIDPDTIHYEVTVEDPKAYTRPWKLVWALVREKAPGFELLEEACWEGERDLPLIREQGYQYYFGEPWRAR